MIKLSEILKALPQLRAEELEQVRKHCAALASVGGKHRIPLSEIKEDWILAGFMYEMQKRGMGEENPSEFFLRNKSDFPKYNEKAHRVRERFDIWDLSNPDKVALGRICAKALAARVVFFAPVTIETLMRNVEKIPEAFDRAFPQYLQCGLVPVLLRAMHSGNVGSRRMEE